MDSLTKLRMMGEQMNLEPAEESDSAPRPTGAADPHAAGPCGFSPASLRGIAEARAGAPLPAPAGDESQTSITHSREKLLPIHNAVMPGGKRIALLKTLLTSACERDCYYCPFRAGRDFCRATFKPDEMAGLFAQMNRAGAVEGLFLSSGIAAGGARTQDRLLDTVEILRRQHEFRGYVHLKLMPGVERDQVLRAMHLADRVSINLEAPNTERLRRLAPHKAFMEELLQPLQWVDEIRRTMPAAKTLKGRWPSMVTQFVVGGAGESDLEILTTTEHLTRRLGLQRAYFSAFNPVRDTPLENRPPENPWREHRLYQASFLLRDYGFDLEDLPFVSDGRLPLDVDPKLGWARANLGQAPVELNRAERRDLLRVPGIGPRGAEALLRARRQGRLRELRDLQKLGILAARAAPFVLLNGRRPQHQLRLF
jgi:predicted DNA-binding helix-hairpin-helix protein